MKSMIVMLAILVMLAGCYQKAPVEPEATQPVVTKAVVEPKCAEDLPAVAEVPDILFEKPEGYGGKVVIESCSNGVVCGPIWPNSECGGIRCQADIGEACCMICQCIGGGSTWCATPSGCYP